MLRYIAKRILWTIPVMLGVLLIIFLLLSITPGDPVDIILGEGTATEEQRAELREELQLDQPVLKRYLNYVWDMLHGSLGESYISNRSIAAEINTKMPYTLKIAFISMFISVLVGIPLGVLAATNQYTLKDNATMFASLFFVSMPDFWLALVLVSFFSVRLGILPVYGVDNWKGYILPCVVTAIPRISSLARQTRSSMLEQIRQDYVDTAKAKGQTRKRIIFGHTLKNALIPVISIVGNQLSYALCGAMIAETVFSIPGLANYLLTGLQKRDYPVVLGSVLYISLVFCIVMLVVDIAYALVDPRVKSQMTRGAKRRKTSRKKEAEPA